jgi:hypothetical protein
VGGDSATPRAFPLALPAATDRPETSTLPPGLMGGGVAAAPANGEDDAGSIVVVVVVVFVVVVFVFVASDADDAAEAAIRDAASFFLASAITAARFFALPLLALLVPLPPSFGEGACSGAGTGVFVVFARVVADDAGYFTLALFFGAGVFATVGVGVGVGVVFVGVGVVVFVGVRSGADRADDVPRAAVVVDDVVVPSFPVACRRGTADGGGEAVAMAAVNFVLFGDKLLLFSSSSSSSSSSPSS